MRLHELLRTAIANALRSRLRTTLTVLAIFVGAFTLTLTNGLGTGITRYIDSQLSGVGGDDVIMVSKGSNGVPGLGSADDGPAEYDPDKQFLSGHVGMQLEALTADDLDAIRAVPGIVRVDPLKLVVPDYIVRDDGTRYELTVNPTPLGSELDLLAGRGFSGDEEAKEVLLPLSYVAPLDFPSIEAAVGRTVTIAVSDASGRQHEVDAVVAGIQEDSLVNAGGMNLSPALVDALYEAQTNGLPPAASGVYAAAIARFDPTLGPDGLARIKADLAASDYRGVTVEDRLGAIQTVVLGIVGVLNAFAVIALVAAGFGIVNTLLMSVQERTREIGLMKALGMGSARVFALFSAEAVFIGFLGSAIGSAVAIALGTVASRILADGALSSLPGLRIVAFDPLSVLLVITLIMALAFLAGTLPATRAARQNPIDALRYE